MVSVSPETLFHRSVVRLIHQRAFGRPDEARLVEALRYSDAYVPELALVAEQDQTLVGHLLFTRLKLQGHPRLRLLALGPVAVAPEFQRTGVGDALIREGLSEARRLGFDAVVVIGHADYYPRFGFVPARSLGLECPWPHVPDHSFLVLPLRPGALDGAQGRLLYPGVWTSP